jgi:hypothetical protein
MANHAPVAAKALLLRGAGLNRRRREAKSLGDISQAAPVEGPGGEKLLASPELPTAYQKADMLGQRP